MKWISQWPARIAAIVLVVAGTGLVTVPAIASGGRAPVSCGVQLRMIERVSRQAGIYVGSVHTSPQNHGTPRQWARELRSVGLRFLARSASVIGDSVTDRDFVEAMTGTAAGYESGQCTNKIRPAMPRWGHWRLATYRFRTQGTSFPCLKVWGQDNQTWLNTGQFAYICEDGTVLQGDNPLP
jgi:hypothetical protein